jgi:hypothetical protein
VALGLIGIFHERTPGPEPIGEPPPCYGTEDGGTTCPEQPWTEETTARKVAVALHDVKEGVVAGFALGGLVCAVLAIRHTRVTRASDAAARRSFRVAVAALILALGLPALGALGLLLLAVTFPIRG